MIKSMTGYGRCEQMVGTRKILCEVRSVNNRYADYNIKLPRHMLALEERVRNMATEYIVRGKVDIYVNVENYADVTTDVVLNEALAGGYVRALTQLKSSFDLPGEVSLSSVSRYSDIFRTERVSEDMDEVWSAIEGVLREAFVAFSDMRAREGARIQSDLVQRVKYMKEIASKIDERSPKIVDEYKARLLTKIQETLGDRTIDEARVLTEVAIFADKVAINEEIVRLASHFDEYEAMLVSSEPVGRRFDFLIQEMNRETNTIGSKATDSTVAHWVVDLKGELEKLREQIQNIE